MRIVCMHMESTDSFAGICKKLPSETHAKVGGLCAHTSQLELSLRMDEPMLSLSTLILDPQTVADLGHDPKPWRLRRFNSSA